MKLETALSVQLSYQLSEFHQMVTRHFSIKLLPHILVGLIKGMYMEKLLSLEMDLPYQKKLLKILLNL